MKCIICGEPIDGELRKENLELNCPVCREWRINACWEEWGYRTGIPEEKFGEYIYNISRLLMKDNSLNKIK